MSLRVRLFAFLCLMSAPIVSLDLPVRAQGLRESGSCAPAVAGNPDGNYIVPGSLGDVAYAAGVTLDAYSPAGEPRPAALILHGSRGDKRGFVTRLYEHLAKAGYAWFAPNYRNEQDVAAALRYVTCPGRFNINRRIILVGEDTGAQTALRLASGGSIAGVVTVGAKLDDTAPRPDVPVLMIHGSEDKEWPSAQAGSYCGQRTNCRFYVQKGAQHTFENWLPAQWDYREELDAWLRNDRRGLWKDIVFARPGGLELRMDAWIPEGPGPFPAVIIAHGGGWEGGDKVTYVAPVFEPLAKAGFAWFSIDYRLTPYVSNPEQIEDVRTAIRFIKKNASRYHVDSNRLALMGESASGQIATLIASAPCPGCEVQAVLCFYGVYDFVAWAKEGRGARLVPMFGTLDETVLRQYSPLFLAHARMPPVLIVQGTGDRLLSGSKSYADRLNELGVRHDLVLLDGAPHGIENWEGHAEWASWKKRMTDWLKDILGQP